MVDALVAPKPPQETEYSDFKVLINNRGEMAQRLLQICHNLGMAAVLACSDPDLDSLPFRTARKLHEEDERFTIAPLRGTEPSQSYENIPVVVASAAAHEVDAVWPGYGFLSENKNFVEKLAQIGIGFVGPSAEVIDIVGGKDSARELAQRCDVPVLPGTGLLGSIEEALEGATTIGYPVMIKAKHAGGGLGNKVANNETELRNHFINMAPKYIDLYLERYVSGARHIEVQIFGDKQGNIVALGERDCSPQRKFQKVLEESPALIVPETTKAKMTESALKMAKEIGYENAGTWEFIYDPTTDEYYFLEVNPRIQVEHTVTEERYGICLPEWQLRIARGEPMPTVPEIKNNHVIEARLYAEKPEHGFQKDSGHIAVLNLPEIEGVRVDQAYEEGDSIPAAFDSTIAKFIATGATREIARLSLIEALKNTTVTGVSTNREFLLWLLDTEEYKNNTVTTTFIENAWARHLLERMRGFEAFLEGGEFLEEQIPQRFDIEAFGHDLTYEKDGVTRTYSADRETMPETCAVKFGTYQDDTTGIRTALGIWDYGVKAGTLGTEEGNAVVALFKLAKEQGLPVTMVTSSAGARQEENMAGLQQMDTMCAAARSKYSAPLFINIYSGINFGGVTASIAGIADIQMAIDGSLIGLTGTGMLARNMGKKLSDLPEGAHSAHDHYIARNIDLIVNDLKEARARAFSFIAGTGLSESNLPYEFDLRDFDASTPSTRFDRPVDQRFTARIGNLPGTMFHKVGNKLNRGRPRGELTPQKRMELIKHPLRPTAADLLNPELNVFEKVMPLSNKITVGSIEQYPAIIGAFAELGGEPVLVLGQQTMRKRGRLTGHLQKAYVKPGPSDFRWALRKIKLAEHLGIPVVLLGDTDGADPSLEAEKYGNWFEIGNFLGELHTVQVPLLSVNIGQNGSGGGLTFIRPLDAAADFSNAMSLVSHIDVQTYIVTKKWPNNDRQRSVLLNQLLDGTPEERKKSGQIDEIIEEPQGGAHTDWLEVSKGLRSFLLRHLAELREFTPTQLLDRRFDRSLHAAQSATRANM